MFLIFIDDRADELTCNHLLFVVDAKVIALKRQQRELRSATQQALSWSRRWDLPLHTRKRHHLSIGGLPDLGISVNSASTLLANVLTVTNKVSGLLYIIKRPFTCLTKEILVPLYSALARPHLEYATQAKSLYLKKGIYHLE